ncbi:hypothetical protein MHBO_004424 [Bonamia ostreae]|uniref:Uncharacterized protein n=1 Tax=Bonamia ostreae TaxID=126728 RepID=A0ABV2AT98_9EUKA
MKCLTKPKYIREICDQDTHNTRHGTYDDSDISSEEYSYSVKIVDQHHIKPTSKSPMTSIKIKNKTYKFIIDTGLSVNILNENRRIQNMYQTQEEQ